MAAGATRSLLASDSECTWHYASWQSPVSLHIWYPCRLPAHTAAAVLQQLPGHTCSPEELRAAVQHASVTRPLLQHLLQAAGDGRAPALQCWSGENLAAALCEALRLADMPLVEAFAEPVLWDRQGMRHKHDEAVCSAAADVLEAAARSGTVEVLRLAGTAASGHAASPACQLLRRAYKYCGQRMAEKGPPAALQLLLEVPGQPLLPDQLLEAALAAVSWPACSWCWHGGRVRQSSWNRCCHRLLGLASLRLRSC